MKIKNLCVGIVNVAIFSSMSAIGAFHYTEVKAGQKLAQISKKDKHCLRQNIFFEARDQSTLGQVAVAWVTLNRVENKNYPNSICDVVWQDSAFSWTNDGRKDTPSDNVIEQRAWKEAKQVTESVLIDWAKGHHSPVEDAYMYHADYVKPYWADSYTRVVSVDNHLFYN